MAASKAVPGKAAAGKRATPMRGGRAGLLLLVVPALLGVAALPLFVLLVAGMVPTLVAAVVDRHPRRYLTIAVALTNLSGLVAPAIALFAYDMSLAGAQHVLGDGRNWLIMYGAAAMGWAINWAMPTVGRFIIDLRADSAERSLRKHAEHLVEEWGPEVDGGGGA
jgi:hypothetical protein